MIAVETKILLVEYTQSTFEFLQKAFEKENYKLKCVHSLRSAIVSLQDWHPQIILIGRLSTTSEGMAAIKQVRTISSDILIVKIADTDHWEAEIEAFEAGADDYVRRPLRTRALAKRMRALLRRLPDQEAQLEVTVGNLYLNRKYNRLEVDGQVIDIPKTDFNLLFFLVTHPDQVFSRKDLVRKVWGETVVIDERAVDVHINTIRNLIGKSQLKTMKKSGYKFKPLSAK